jgi:hypothetical protein
MKPSLLALVALWVSVVLLGAVAGTDVGVVANTDTNANAHVEILSNLAEAAVDGDDEENTPAQAPGAGQPGANGQNIQTPLTSVTDVMLHIMLQKQMLQQQQSTSTMMQLQLIRMKMLATMDANREIKARMRHMRRHAPGGCDCCQACKAKPVVPNIMK